MLFSADVSLHAVGDVKPLSDRPGIWALSDSNGIIDVQMFAFARTDGPCAHDQTASIGGSAMKNGRRNAMFYCISWAFGL